MGVGAQEIWWDVMGGLGGRWWLIGGDGGGWWLMALDGGILEWEVAHDSWIVGYCLDGVF